VTLVALTTPHLGTTIIHMETTTIIPNLDNEGYTAQRVLFAGDIHGDMGHAKYVFAEAKKQGCTHIIACGDFGYWVHLPQGEKFVNTVAQLAEKNDIKFLWVDGNHENHDLLNDLVDTYGDTQPIDTPNEWCQWIPRGCRFQIGDNIFMGYGGAYSVDWQDRVEGISWWRGELINPYHIDELSNEQVDILVTHEAPLGKQISYKDEIPVSVSQRALVSELVQKVTPCQVVCGHHHTREEWYINDEIKVDVLGRDGMGEESYLVLDV
jgi:Icc-related predicted phosphoesterase